MNKAKEEKISKKKILSNKEIKKKKIQEQGITLIALVITIVLNCWRSGRNKVNNLLKYKKMILKNNVTLENT